jgi:hypothetical protein
MYHGIRDITKIGNFALLLLSPWTACCEQEWKGVCTEHKVTTNASGFSTWWRIKQSKSSLRSIRHQAINIYGEVEVQLQAYMMLFFLVLASCRLVGRCQRFGDTYCLHIQGWSGDAGKWWDVIGLEEGKASFPTRRQNPEQHHSPHRRENLEVPRIVNFCTAGSVLTLWSPFPPGKDPPVPTERLGGVQSRSGRSPRACQEWNPGHPARSQSWRTDSYPGWSWWRKCICSTLQKANVLENIALYTESSVRDIGQDTISGWTELPLCQLNTPQDKNNTTACYNVHASLNTFSIW